ncbi:putative lactoylglutathione lyase [Hoeflea sp. IMCC20628]|uniref:VOC family protein n=1 Tax=Hoeflea sp. IMCC20628 TaxID=1620421 RepID=UPI00063AFA86|nr:VOC family protein [Hoeflea sp. IMCC20628]AKI01039.1 putative lactoylglutathione lyase [Hoeflea sp. IMCC20628]
MSFDPRITMITLGVADVAVATAFYQRLGFKRSSASNDSVTFFHMNGTVLGLFGRDALAADAGQEPTRRHGFEGVTLAHNFGSRTEVDTAWEFAVECGAKPVKKPHEVFWGGYSGYFADPDGHLWELAHNPFMPLGEDGHMSLPD